jgi:Plavaka transposase
MLASQSCAADREHDDSTAFRKFRRQLFHSSLAVILDPLRQGMTSPEIRRCPDGHLRRVVYGLGPYIADYPEQVLLACVVNNWCPRYVEFPLA